MLKLPRLSKQNCAPPPAPRILPTKCKYHLIVIKVRCTKRSSEWLLRFRKTSRNLINGSLMACTPTSHPNQKVEPKSGLSFFPPDPCILRILFVLVTRFRLPGQAGSTALWLCFTGKKGFTKSGKQSNMPISETTPLPLEAEAEANRPLDDDDQRL